MITNINEYKKYLEKLHSDLEYDLYKYFDQINKECFNNELLIPTLGYKSMKNRLGVCVCGYKITNGRKQFNPSSIRIFITNKYKLPEQTFKDVLCHEMIHQYFFQNNIDEGHGYRFLNFANKINKMNLGYNITIKNDEALDFNMDDDTYNKEYLVVLKKDDNRNKQFFANYKQDQATLNNILFNLDNIEPKNKNYFKNTEFEFYRVKDKSLEHLTTSRYKKDNIQLSQRSMVNTTEHDKFIEKIKNYPKIAERNF